MAFVQIFIGALWWSHESVFAQRAGERGLDHPFCQIKTCTLVHIFSVLQLISTLYLDVMAKTGRIGVRIMCPGRVMFSVETVLYNIKLAR